MIYKKIDLIKEYHLNTEVECNLYIYEEDLSYEVNLNRKFLPLLIIPGGDYEFTSFREKEPVALKFLSEGFASFVLEYSCGEKAKFPLQLLEGYLALDYINKNKEELHIDISKLGLIGFSAGAHLNGLLSSSYLKEEFIEEYKLNIPKIAYSAYGYPVVNQYDEPREQSFINLFKNEKLRMQSDLSLPKLINKNNPRAFIFSTVEDSVVPIKNTISLISAYKENAVPFEVHIFEHGEHGLSLGNISVYNLKYLEEFSKTNSKWFDLFLIWLKHNKIVIEE